MRTRAECIAAAAPLVAAGWRQLHEAWVENGHAGIAALSGEEAARTYESWVAEDRTRRAAGSAA